MAESTTNQTTSQTSEVQILKCFCGCTDLTIDEVQRIAHMNVTDLIENQNSKNLFKSFLKLGHHSDKSRALEELECYELCQLLYKHQCHRTDENIDTICDMCPNYSWECDLREKYENITDNLEDFLQFLILLMSENKRNIEAHTDYKRFHETMMKKLKKCNLLKKTAKS